MESLTPAQKEQLKTWASERDSLLSEIAVKKTEKETITKDVKDLAITKTEIQNDIVRSEGRMEELDKKEKLYEEIVSIEIPKLESEKTRLEAIITGYQKEVSYLDLKKEGLIRDIEFLTNIHKDVFERTGALEKIVDHVTKVSSSNVKEIEEMVVTLKDKINEILKISAGDLEAHKKVLEDIPKLFVELQRKVLLRDELRKVK